MIRPYWRTPPAACEACGEAPPQVRVAVSAHQPGSKLPDALLGATTWACDAPACAEALRDRALAACARHGLASPRLLHIGPRLGGGLPDMPAQRS